MRFLFAILSLLLFLPILLVFIHQLHAKIIRVPQEQNTIQKGIDFAGAHDTVLVDLGQYNENLMIINKSIVLASTYIISNDTSIIQKTILDGASIGHVIEISESVQVIFYLTK